ncbi:MAG: hypothetical protein WDA17_05000 [Sphaerochaetaceae bacterium]
MEKRLQKSVLISAVLLVVLIILLIIFGSGQGKSPVGLYILSILVFLGLIGIVWFKYFTEGKTEEVIQKPPVKKAEVDNDKEPTRTGQICTETGSYACSEHTEMVVDMSEGKRFPPCRGDGVGHSAVWVLKE